jgi:hypothetical protein
MSNLFYSEVDAAVQLELNARGNSGKRRNTQDLNFMLGKIANVQLTAYKSGSADPKSILDILGGTTVRSGRYQPSGPDGFLTNPKYTVTEIKYEGGIATTGSNELTDYSRRIGPIITAVSVDIGDHSMGLLNKAIVNITIPNPTRDLDTFEDTWLYPGRYVKIDIEHPKSAIITGADTNLISTASLFGSLSEEIIDTKLKKLYPSLLNDLTAFKQEIRKLNKFSFQGLITSFDFSYTEDASVDVTISLTGTSNTYTDVSMLMNPDVKKVENVKAVEYNTVATSSVAELENLGQPTGSTEFYGQLYNEFERLRTNFKNKNKLTTDPELLLKFKTSNSVTGKESSAPDGFILYGQLYPGVQLPTYQRATFAADPNSTLSLEDQQAQFNEQQAAQEQAFNDNPKRQTYVEVQRYITLGGLIDFINNKIITKITGAADAAAIICSDSVQFSNYYPALTSSKPKDVLLLPKNSNLDQSNGGMNVYGELKMYPTVVNNMTTYNDPNNPNPPWPGITDIQNDTTVICPSRIFLNLQMIQEILNSISETNTKSFTVTDFLANISARIVTATGNAINLKLVSDPNLPTTLTFSDTKYLKPLNTTVPVKPYSVPMLANHPTGSIVREFSFKAKLPNNVKNLSYVLNAGTDVSDDEIAPYLNFMYNSKDPAAINLARDKYKEKHNQIISNLNDAKTSYGKIPFVSENATKLNKALIEYIKYPFDNITKSQQLTAPIFPFDVEFTIDGINGLRYGDVLTFDALPEKYKKNTVFSVIGITHDVDTDGDWKQQIKCIMRPKIG